MILEPSEVDLLLCAKRLKEIKPSEEKHPSNYRDCCVLKPWGYEFELFDDKNHAVWVLTIRAGKSTSLHCHQHKSAMLIPLQGELSLLTLGNKPRVIESGASVSLLPKTFHGLWNSGAEDLIVLEIESPSMKLDLIRAEDAWGRQNEGYEGESAIVREGLEQYGYGHIGEDETIHRFGHDITITQGGITIRKPA